MFIQKGRFNKIFMNFAQKLQILRMSKGYSQKEMAEFVNVTQPTIWAYESGRAKPHLNTLKQLARALNVSVDDLADDIEKPNTEGSKN